jgi:hypothetical protein
MTPKEYAAARGKTLDEVQQALSATDQPVHPQSSVDSDKLDAYFGEQPATQPKPDVLHIDQIEQVAPPSRQDTPATKVKAYGHYEPGMKLYRLQPFGTHAPKMEHEGFQEFLSFGHDSSQAIANVVSHWARTSPNANLRSNRMTWRVLGTVPFGTRPVAV